MSRESAIGMGWVTVLAALLCLNVRAQDEAIDPEKFEQQSVALRTALHYDPSLEAPLKNLTSLYVDAGRGEELLSLYRNHTTEYPQDEGGRVVLIRLMREMRRVEAGGMVARAREDFPGSALVAYLSFQELNQERDARALDVLSEAITAEVHLGRKALWIDELVELAVSEGRSDVAAKHLREWAETPGQTAQSLLSLANRMSKAKFYELVLQTLEQARGLNTSAELNVDIELLASAAEGSLGRYDEAGERLDVLLKGVASDYWRRSEIVSRRVNLLRTDAGREQMLKVAQARFEAEPKLEAAALDLGELLTACELRRDALAVYLKAAENLPNSERIEREVLVLFDRLNDVRGARDYLEGRLENNPERLDLEYRLVKVLFVIGEKSKGEERFEGLLGKLDESARLVQSLELGRYLRRMGIPGAATVYFKQVAAMAPERLDVRRELAESLMAEGKRDEARKLFTAELAEGAEIENFIDVVQFMIQQEILIEAEKAIANRLGDEAGNFELGLMHLDVQGKLGDQVGGEQRLESLRLLADTEARYRSWFEGATKFHELFETLDAFLDGEQARLVGGEVEWTPQRIARFQVFCDVADRSEERERVVGVVRAQIAAEETPSDLRLELRRLLVRLLERDSKAVAEVQENLEVLEKNDGGRAGEYRLQMGKMYLDANQAHLAEGYLADVDFAEIRDSGLLSGLHLYYLDRGRIRDAVAVLQRVAALEPTNRLNWETWLTFLAAMGEEGELRYAIRQLLVGIDRMPLSDETLELLREHLGDSYWRTIATRLASGDDERLGEVFSLLDAIEGNGGLPSEQLWVPWTRAHVLCKQGRERAKEEALLQLEQAATAVARRESVEGDEVQEVMIYFPDGLAVSLEAAVRILREPVGVYEGSKGREVVGPLPELKVDWAFETDFEVPVVQILPMVNGDVLLFDRSGTLYRVGGVTGKLVWRKTRSELMDGESEEVVRGAVGARVNRSVSVPVVGQVLPTCVVDGDGNVYVPMGSKLMAVWGDSGERMWVAEVGGEEEETHRITGGVSLFLDGDQVLGYRAATGVVAAFDRGSGKLNWERELVSDGGSALGRSYVLSDFSTGASYSNGRLLVYGRSAAVIETRTGETIWSFKKGAAGSFPIRLASPDEGEVGGSLMPVASLGMTSMVRRVTSARAMDSKRLNYLSGRSAGDVDGQFARNGGALVAPAVAWAEWVEGGAMGMGVLAGDRLILMGSGIDVLSLDLPLAGEQYNLYQSQFVGVSGNKACFLSEKRLTILNLSRHTMVSASLADLVEQHPSELQVGMAGARVYVSGGKGVKCFNLHTGGEIFYSPWPEVVQRFLLPRLEGGDDKSINQTLSHQWQGRIVKPEAVLNTRYQALGQSVNRSASFPAMPVCYGLVSEVAVGRMFTLVSPHQVVAISETDAENNQTKGSDANE